jgi:hypothetical protein
MMTMPCELGVALGASATEAGAVLDAMGSGEFVSEGGGETVGAAVGVVVQPMTKRMDASVQRASQREIRT